MTYSEIKKRINQLEYPTPTDPQIRDEIIRLEKQLDEKIKTDEGIAEGFEYWLNCFEYYYSCDEWKIRTAFENVKADRNNAHHQELFETALQNYMPYAYELDLQCK